MFFGGDDKMARFVYFIHPYKPHHAESKCLPKRGLCARTTRQGTTCRRFAKKINLLCHTGQLLLPSVQHTRVLNDNMVLLPYYPILIFDNKELYPFPLHDLVCVCVCVGVFLHLLPFPPFFNVRVSTPLLDSRNP